MKVHATTDIDLSKHAQGTANGWDVVKFPSDSTPGKFYTVDVTHGRCSCLAWIFANKKNNGLKPTCKHLNRLGFKETPNEPLIAEPKKHGVGVTIKQKVK